MASRNALIMMITIIMISSERQLTQQDAVVVMGKKKGKGKESLCERAAQYSYPLRISVIETSTLLLEHCGVHEHL